MFFYRIKTSLFITSIFVLILGPLLVSTANHLLDMRFQTNRSLPSPEQAAPLESECVPGVDQTAYTALENIDFNQKADSTVSRRMAEIFLADQAVRQLPGSIDPLKLDEEDTLRRIETLGYITTAQIHNVRDLYYAAFIFQHGKCPEHYRFANHLAQIALDSGYPEAGWIYAATLDRYLMSLGELQKYGTQYTWINGEYKLYPVDPSTTDAERAEYNVPPLGKAKNHKPVTIGSGGIRKRWLETWWLTLIGAAFAILSAATALQDAKKNALHGWGALILALVLLAASVVGHYAQLIALSQGTAETQAPIWMIANILLMGIWLVFTLVEIYQVLKQQTKTPLEKS